jgi:hypothetical protein
LLSRYSTPPKAQERTDQEQRQDDIADDDEQSGRRAGYDQIVVGPVKPSVRSTASAAIPTDRRSPSAQAIPTPGVSQMTY